ncbi:MAG: sel1 repeat family protein [Akkermansia sp.]|nr:sel1 repeat family protein [Akkermansia sp.]
MENIFSDTEDNTRMQAFSEKMSWLHEKADSGDIFSSIALLGVYTMAASDSRESRQRAYHYASIAANAEHPSGYFTMAGLLRMDGGEENEQKAEAYLRKAVKAGHLEAPGELGRWLLDRNENLKEAAELLQRSVSRGCTEYALDLYECLKKLGNDVAAFKSLVTWVKKSPSEGSAYFYLGNCYMKGDGIAANPRKAVDAYRRGVNCGDFRCILMMAAAYYKGMGTGCKPDKGLALLKKAVGEIDDDLSFESIINLCCDMTIEEIPEEDYTSLMQLLVERAKADEKLQSLVVQYAEENGTDSLPLRLRHFVINE